MTRNLYLISRFWLRMRPPSGKAIVGLTMCRTLPEDLVFPSLRDSIIPCGYGWQARGPHPFRTSSTVGDTHELVLSSCDTPSRRWTKGLAARPVDQTSRPKGSDTVS